MKLWWSILVAVGVGWAGAGEPAPLAQAHSHNDYEHARPLMDALVCGFCSIEADIWLVDGRLLVAHTILRRTWCR